MDSLPETASEFLDILKFENIETWPYRSTLKILKSYSNLKKLECKDKWLLKEVEDFIYLACDTHNARSTTPKELSINFDFLHTPPLPSRLIELEHRIWFTRLIMEQTPNRWYQLDTAYRELVKHVNERVASRKSVKKFIGDLKAEERFYLEKLIQHQIELPKIDPIRKIDLVKKIYPSLTQFKPSKEMLSELISAPRIGMGLDSTFKPSKIRREAVVIDSNTKNKSHQDKHIIYTPGWSLKNPSTE